MTNTTMPDPFEDGVRDAFRRKLETLDPLIPAQLRSPRSMGREVSGVAATPRMRPGLTLGSGAVRFAAITGVLVLVAALAGPSLLMRGSGATNSPAGSTAHSQSPGPITSPSAVPVDRTVTLVPRVVASFGTDELTDAVLGPDGAAYVIDATDDTVYRVNLDTGDRIKVVESGLRYGSGNWIFGKPVRLAVGGPDVVILDDRNNVWTWREATGDKTGRGVLKQVLVPDSATWGSGVKAIGTFVVNDKLGLYNLYVASPAARQILKYAPASDGSGYPTEGRSSYLALPQGLSSVDDVYVDGYVYLSDSGGITRYDRGQVDKSWLSAAEYPATTKPFFTVLGADDPADPAGLFFAYDRANHLIVQLSKVFGVYMAGYRAAMNDVRALFAVNAAGLWSLYWIDGGSLFTARLPGGTANPSPSRSASAAPATARVVASFGTDDVGAVALDGNLPTSAYVVDATWGTVVRVDSKTGAKLALPMENADTSNTTRISKPLGVWWDGFLVIVDGDNRFWWWSPVGGDSSGSRALYLREFVLPPSFTWGTGLRALCVVDGHPTDGNEGGAHDYYAVSQAGVEVIKWDPVAQMVRLTHAFDVDQRRTPVDDIYVPARSVEPIEDGIFLVQGGKIVVYRDGKPDPTWSFAQPAGSYEHQPYYTRITGDSLGSAYAYDRANQQLVVFSHGAYAGIALASPALDGLKAMTVGPSQYEPTTLWWTAGGKLWTAPLSAGSAVAP